MTYIPESSPIYNKSTSNRRRTSPYSNIHVGPLSNRAKEGAYIASGIYSANKTGNKSGLVSKLFGGMFGGGGGGISGFFGNLFGGTGSEMMGKAAMFNVLGGFLKGFDKTQEKLDARRLDIQEKLGMEQIRVQEMKAKDAIRQTGIASTFMGWTNPIAAVEGIVEPTPGLTVAAPVSPTEVSSNAGGIIGGNNQGLITQAQQRVVG